MKNLTLKQKLFCKTYIDNGGNGTEAVLNSGYRVKDGDRNTAAMIASENLRKPNIKNYIEELYKADGLNASKVEYEHSYVINQRNDLSTKMKAIDIYYKL